MVTTSPMLEYKWPQTSGSFHNFSEAQMMNMFEGPKIHEWVCLCSNVEEGSYSSGCPVAEFGIRKRLTACLSGFIHLLLWGDTLRIHQSNLSLFPFHWTLEQTGRSEQQQSEINEVFVTTKAWSRSNRKNFTWILNIRISWSCFHQAVIQKYTL